MTTIETEPRASTDSPENIFGENILEREIIDGIEWVSVYVPDRFIESGDYETYQRLRNQSDWVDAQLRDELIYDRRGQLRPQKKPRGESAPADNEFSREIYKLPGMREWYDDTPSARALLPLHDPLRDSLPGRSHRIDEESRNFFRYSLDAQAIRARNSVVSRLAAASLQKADTPIHISYGSGVAVPVLEAFLEVDSPNTIQAFLVDNDLDSHSMAKIYEHEVSKEVDHWNVATDYVEADIVDGLIRSDALVDRLGRGQAAVVDVVGVAEYFPSSLASRMLKNAYENVRPANSSTGDEGGVLLWGNMLDEHPQLAFNQCAIRWPDIHPRSRSQLAEIIDGMGVPRQNVTAYVSADGVYAVLEVRKMP